MGAKTFDHVIVGNGAVGLFLARELATQDRGRIAICGDSVRTGGASRAAGAMLGCFAELTAEILNASSSVQKFEFGLQARAQWPKILSELRAIAHSTDIVIEPIEDTYVVLNSRGGLLDSENFEAIIAGAEKYQEPWQEVAPESIPAFRPRPDYRALRAIHLPNEGAVDSNSVLAVLEHQLAQNDLVEWFGTVDSIELRDDRAAGVRLHDGSFLEAGNVIVTMGARGPSLVERVLPPGELIPTFSGLGFSAVTRRNRGSGFNSVIRTPNRAFACGLHLVPLPHGREYIGATNMVVGEARDEPIVGDVHFLLDCAIRQLDEDIYHHSVPEFRVGNRPVTIDGLPLIGWTSRAGLYLVTGTYRDGFHNAPVIAEHVAAELGGRSGLLGERYRPGRSPDLHRTVLESISDFVKHRIAAWFEAGAQAPPNMSVLELERTLQDQAAGFYQQLGITVGLPPDILMHVLGTLRSPRTLGILRGLRESS